MDDPNHHQPEVAQRVTYEGDTRLPNAGAFTILREDHTLGNLLRMQLLRDPDVYFAGYKATNDPKRKIIVRIQTTDQSTPTQAYNRAINDVGRQLDRLKPEFEFEKLLNEAISSATQKDAY